MKRFNKASIILALSTLLIGLLIGSLVIKSGTKSEEHNHGESVDQTWTCSMHPQIMQPEPGDCPICGMDLIPAANSSDGLLADQFKLTENAIALANIVAWCFYMAKKKEVKDRRYRDQIITALRARKFTGIETLQMGFDLTNIALKAAGERQREKD